jgi:hypothetical protein
MTQILRKNSGFDGQFTLIDTFNAGFVRILAAKGTSSPGRAPSAAHIASARGIVKTRLRIPGQSDRDSEDIPIRIPKMI